MHDSGVRVREGDFVALLAKGEIDYWTGRGGYVFGPERSLLYRFGEKGFYKKYRYPNYIRISQEEKGNIFFGHQDGEIDPYGEAKNPNYYLDNRGHFVVDIIVWEEKNFVQAANFIEEASMNDPTNEALRKIAVPLERHKKHFLAEQKKKQEIEETKNALLALKEKEISQTKDLQKEKQVAELNERLQKALQALKDLEDLKKKMDEQKEKEKELLARMERLEIEKGKQAKIPPVIAIAFPQDGLSVDSEYLTITGAVEDEEGIAKFEILVNDQVATQKDQRGLQIVAKDLRKIDFAEKIRLRAGKNEIAVVAHDIKGLMGKKSISIQYAKKKENVWAVVVGINKYKNFPSLKYSVNDAREFYRYLTEVNQIPKDQVWLLLDEEATLDKLRSTLGTHLRRQAGKDDMVIIYLAGHGATERDSSSPDGDGLEKYILPHNADPKDLYSSALPMSEVARIFQRISSERLVFVSDTCYSGASGGRTVPLLGSRANVSGAFLERISHGKGRVIITASDANEVSVEKDELKHGVFTYYLLEALRGKGDADGDGVITVDEVYRYVSTKVPQATGQEQHPVKKGEMKGEIILGVVK